jgi:hypothetical protein
MTARDLLLRRTTTEKGETIWQTTPLSQGLKHGGLVILDGIDRLGIGTIAVIVSLETSPHCAPPNVPSTIPRGVRTRCLVDSVGFAVAISARAPCLVTLRDELRGGNCLHGDGYFWGFALPAQLQQHPTQ